ncbi:DUF4747 family protein [Mangrovibacterium marinum]|uniref:Uncharacterized protein DUF4747 n=1 Tax=Mangrovibacterium marinum TaxID=1639118 RepID=A0A2T5C4Q1_9BACT|nr:DUF4747 family protein [Mangrovibacterium marinum]PTN09842.1 uncharacterized protein DUF4747 [Mangrovibacterium marinum]
MDNQNSTQIFQFKVLNVKLVSRKETSSNIYHDLMQSVFDNDIKINFKKHVGFINDFTAVSSPEGNYFYGRVTKAEIAGDNYELKKDNTLEVVEHEGQYYTNPVQAYFIFVPQAHRFAFLENEKIKIAWFKSFIVKSFQNVIGEDEKIDAIIKTTDTFVEDYLKTGDIRKIRIKLSYSNSDSFNNPAMKAMEENFKNTHLREVTLTGVSDKKGNIDLMNNEILNPLAGLAIDNGEISAWSQDNTSSQPTITTKDVQAVYDIKVTDKTWMFDIFNKMIDLFRPQSN